MECYIDYLPIEVLSLIFSYLEVPDRLDTCLVSKKWLQVMNCRSLLNDICVKINHCKTIQIFSSMTRDFFKFHIISIIIDENCITLFKLIASQVELIALIDCKICINESANLNISFNNLRTLKIINCDLWYLFASVPKLSNLTLCGQSTISDEGVFFLQKSMKHLESLTLDTCGFANPLILKRFYPHRQTLKEQPSPHIFSFTAIKSFISERISTLSELHLTNNNITDADVKELSCIKGLKLSKIVFNLCNRSCSCLIDLVRNQTNLKTLHIKNGSNLKYEIIDAICTFLPHIESLEIHYCKFSDESLSKLFQLDCLIQLGLFYCHGISEIGFNIAVSNFKPTQIKYLYLNRLCFNFVSANTGMLIKQCRYLVHLNLNFCKIQDTEVHVISEFLVHLEDLNLFDSQITDYGLTGMSSTCTEEKTQQKPISNLKCLKKLDLGMSKITNDGAITAIKYQFLKYLCLSGCDVSMITMKTLFAQNPILSQIRLQISNLDRKTGLKLEDNGMLC